MPPASCSLCQNFIKDTVGDGLGIGRCLPYEAYEAKKPTAKALAQAFEKLGNKLFWCGNDDRLDRNCAKYKPKDNHKNENEKT